MGMQTTWTHGHAVVVEDAGQYSSIRYRGWGTELNYGSPGEGDDDYRVCHVPLATPPIIDGAAPTLTKLFVLFETSPNVFVTQIDIWDANIPVAQTHNHPEFEPAVGLFVGNGSHLTLDRNNQLPLPQPYRVSFGIGVSLVCGLVGASPLRLTVAAIGAEYEIPVALPTGHSTSNVHVSVKRSGPGR